MSGNRPLEFPLYSDIGQKIEDEKYYFSSSIFCPAPLSKFRFFLQSSFFSPGHLSKAPWLHLVRSFICSRIFGGAIIDGKVKVGSIFIQTWKEPSAGTIPLFEIHSY